MRDVRSEVVKCLFKCLSGNRLEKEGTGICFIAFNCVFLITGNIYDIGSGVLFKYPFCYVDPVCGRHIYVKKYDIKLMIQAGIQYIFRFKGACDLGIRMDVSCLHILIFDDFGISC